MEYKRIIYIVLSLWITGATCLTKGIVITGPNRKVFGGQKVNFQCSLLNIDPDEVRSVAWDKDGKIIYKFNHIDQKFVYKNIISNSDVEVNLSPNTTELTINYYNQASVGTYSCTVETKSGTTFTQSKNVAIKSNEGHPISIIVPNEVKVEDTVKLFCQYNSSEGLYIIKWYKGNHEVFRFMPDEDPKRKSFYVQGITIDFDGSDDHNIVLKNVTYEASGKYTCEVTDKSLDTYFASTEIRVKVPPKGEPTIFVDNDYPKYRDIVHAECASPPAAPPATIKWLLNGKSIRGTNSDHLHSYSGFPLPSHSSVGISALPNVFKGNEAELTCIIEFDYEEVSKKTIRLKKSGSFNPDNGSFDPDYGYITELQMNGSTFASPLVALVSIGTVLLIKLFN